MMMSEITNPNPCLHTCLSIVDFSTASAKMFRRTKDSIVSGGDDSCFELNWIEPDQWSTFCANFVAQAARKLHQIIYFLYSVEGKGVEWQKCQEKNVNVFMLTCNTLSSENIKTQKNVVLVSSCREANYDKSRDKIPSAGRCSFLPLFPWFAKLSAKSKKRRNIFGDYHHLLSIFGLSEFNPIGTHVRWRSLQPQNRFFYCFAFCAPQAGNLLSRFFSFAQQGERRLIKVYLSWHNLRLSGGAKRKEIENIQPVKQSQLKVDKQEATFQSEASSLCCTIACRENRRNTLGLGSIFYFVFDQQAFNHTLTNHPNKFFSSGIWKVVNSSFARLRLMTEILNIKCHVTNYQEMWISAGVRNVFFGKEKP